MSLTNYVPSRGRVYVRKFDHEDAIRRYNAGESIPALAGAYGVTDGAVRRVVIPGEKAKRDARSRAWRTGTCEGCGGQAMRLVHGKKERNLDGRVLCVTCRGLERRERLRFDEQGRRLLAVRCSNLDCANGERWQTPEQFPGGARYRDVRPQGIHSCCRSCQTRMKRRYRESHPEYRRTNGSAGRRRNAEAVSAARETER